MFCRQCGEKIEEGCSVCGKCGTAVSEGLNRKNKILLISMIAVASLALILLVVSVTVYFMSSRSNTKQSAVTAESDENSNNGSDNSDESNTVSTSTESKDTEESGSNNTQVSDVKTISRPILITEDGTEASLLSIVPSVPVYQVEKNLGNVINGENFLYNENLVRALETDGFAVDDDTYEKEFYDIYEENRYRQTPNFVTVDSLMHTYHIYFAYLLRSIEKNHLCNELSQMTDSMLDASYNQYLSANGEWKEAAKRNVAFFSVGKVLLDKNATFPNEVSDIVNSEYSKIMKAEGIDKSEIRQDEEDYSQYKPRGYYEGDASLEKYFRAMMWYGRIQFNQNDESMDRSALLMTKAMEDSCITEWESIYSVTSFFAGASDDLGYYEYMPAIESVYGEDADLDAILADEDAFTKFHNTTATLRAPRINSIPIDEGESNVILGYRFMGQRFTIDATVMQQLIYSRVGTETDARMLPDVLDVPAALGSDVAYDILKDEGETSYKNYDENLAKLREEFDNNDSTLWNASLYANWLNTLRPLLDEKGEGYPMFMQGKKWAIKDLECFAGSYTELKHDTVLYSKQPMAEMGGDWEEDVDDRGYVEPEVLVYYRFTRLTESMSDVLKSYGYLSDADAENLSRLANISRTLQTISEKELRNELLTDEEYEFIKNYGGETEHLWLEAMRAQTGEEYPNSDLFPAALVVDIATDPNGEVLEAATGNPARIYVAVPVDGKIRIAVGAVYNFYEFTQPISDRLTDKEWRRMLGVEIESYEEADKYIVDVPRLDWIQSYRID